MAHKTPKNLIEPRIKDLWAAHKMFNKALAQLSTSCRRIDHLSGSDEFGFDPEWLLEVAADSQKAKMTALRQALDHITEAWMHLDAMSKALALVEYERIRHTIRDASCDSSKIDGDTTPAA